MDQFVIVGKDGTHTTWQVPGFKQAIRLPNDFVAKLSKVLRLKCVASWLQDLRGAILKAEESCGQIKEAQAIVENWRQEYNNYRPHSSLDYQTPDEFARQYYEKNQVEARSALETAGILSL